MIRVTLQRHPRDGGEPLNFLIPTAPFIVNCCFRSLFLINHTLELL